MRLLGCQPQSAFSRRKRKIQKSTPIPPPLAPSPPSAELTRSKNPCAPSLADGAMCQTIPAQACIRATLPISHGSLNKVMYQSISRHPPHLQAPCGMRCGIPWESHKDPTVHNPLVLPFDVGNSIILPPAKRGTGCHSDDLVGSVALAARVVGV